MTLNVPNEGEAYMLDAITGKTAATAPILCLYTNNITPAETDTVATYTEASGFGYANVTLASASWNAATAGNPSFTTYAQQTFTFTGALGNVYGYFIKSTTSGKLLWSELFSDGPYNIANNGDQIKITPRLEQS